MCFHELIIAYLFGNAMKFGMWIASLNLVCGLLRYARYDELVSWCLCRIDWLTILEDHKGYAGLSGNGVYAGGA